MSGRGDNLAGPGAGRATPLLVVVELSPSGARLRRALPSREAIRLAAALGAQTRFVTWSAGAEVVLTPRRRGGRDRESGRPAAVLVQDGDAGRQLAPLVAHELGTRCRRWAAATLRSKPVRPSPPMPPVPAATCPQAPPPDIRQTGVRRVARARRGHCARLRAGCHSRLDRCRYSRGSAERCSRGGRVQAEVVPCAPESLRAFAISRPSLPTPDRWIWSTPSG